MYTNTHSVRITLAPYAYNIYIYIIYIIYNIYIYKGGAQGCEAYEVKERVALVRVPFYFINLLPTSLLYISILLTYMHIYIYTLHIYIYTLYTYIIYIYTYIHLYREREMYTHTNSVYNIGTYVYTYIQGTCCNGVCVCLCVCVCTHTDTHYTHTLTHTHTNTHTHTHTHTHTLCNIGTQIISTLVHEIGKVTQNICY
jgi:hypothetical protein